MVAISLVRSGEELDGKPPGLQCCVPQLSVRSRGSRGRAWMITPLQSPLTTVWPASQWLASAHQEIAILVHSRLITRMHQGRRIQFFNNGWSGTTLPQRRHSVQYWARRESTSLAEPH